MNGTQQMLFDDDVPPAPAPTYFYCKAERSWPPRSSSVIREDVKSMGASPGALGRDIVWPHDHDDEFHTWGDDLKPENEGITAEEYEFLAFVDSNGGFV
jgi:hypothetical protein